MLVGKDDLSYDYDMANGLAKQISPSWVQSVDGVHAHVIAEKDGLMICGRGGQLVKCSKQYYGGSTWESLPGTSINENRYGAASSYVMGGIFVTCGRQG